VKYELDKKLLKMESDFIEREGKQTHEMKMWVFLHETKQELQSFYLPVAVFLLIAMYVISEYIGSIVITVFVSSLAVMSCLILLTYLVVIYLFEYNKRSIIQSFRWKIEEMQVKTEMKLYINKAIRSYYKEQDVFIEGAVKTDKKYCFNPIIKISLKGKEGRKDVWEIDFKFKNKNFKDIEGNIVVEGGEIFEKTG